MNLPPPSDPLWSDIVTGRRRVAFEFLAARMLVTRLQMTAMRDKSPQNVSLLAGQLHELFAENRTLPAAKKDLAKLGL
jgi:hypothetical protein